MSIIRPESIIYRIIAGKYEGRTCVIYSEGAQVTDLAKIIFNDGNHNEFGTIKKGELAALDVPGWPNEMRIIPYGLRQYLEKEKGNGSNSLRTEYVAQPFALKQGDVLATGEVVIEHPRRGYNSSALIHLDKSGWVELAPRLPIALAGNKKFKLPVELSVKNKLITGCRIAERSFSLKANWTKVFLNERNCCIETPSCIPLALK
jgi:hypothetical protein